MFGLDDGVGNGPLPNEQAYSTGIVDAIAAWCEALHGSHALNDALAQLLVGLGAEAGMLVRTHMNGSAPVRIAVHDRLARTVARPLRQSFADGFFGRNMLRARTGSVWIGSARLAEEDIWSDPALEDWQRQRGLGDFAVLVLSSAPTRDHIELHFRDHLGADREQALTAMMPTIARTWATRRPGIVTRLVAEQRKVADISDGHSPHLPLLGVSNPARLSRAEFRVCILLAGGLSVPGVSAELGLTEATVRSHLRSIYAKTGTTSLAQLVFRLIGTRPGETHANARLA